MSVFEGQKKKAIHREEWLKSLERIVGARSYSGFGLTKRFRFNSNSTGSIRKLSGRKSIIKLQKVFKRLFCLLLQNEF